MSADEATPTSLRCTIDPTEQAWACALMLGLAHVSWPMGGLLVHSCGLGRPGQGAVVALALSGGGKSTLNRLATSFDSLSDETLLLWPGEKPEVSATRIRSSSPREPQPLREPLRAFLLLEKSPSPSFERVSASRALQALAKQVYRLPPGLASPADVFRRAAAVVEQVPAYRFAFPKDPEDVADRLLNQLWASL